MKAWIQRVTEASVTIGGEKVAEIGVGYLILLGVAPSDAEADADSLAERVAAFRIFEDDQRRMNRSIIDAGGSVIVVSQFTLYADTSRGRHGPTVHQPDAGNRLRVVDRGIAIVESVVADLGDAPGDGHVRKAAAVGKRQARDALDAF